MVTSDIYYIKLPTNVQYVGQDLILNHYTDFCVCHQLYPAAVPYIKLKSNKIYFWYNKNVHNDKSKASSQSINKEKH